MGGKGSGGHNALPDAVLKLQGTWRRDRHGGRPTAKPLLKAPEPPAWLNPVAKAEWRRLAPELEAMGLLSDLDLGAFACYCQAFALWRKAADQVAAEGTTTQSSRGRIRVHPAVKIERDALAAMVSWAREFGMLPGSRAHLGPPTPPAGGQ